MPRLTSEREASEVSFRVFGQAQTKGSTRSFITRRGRVVTTSDNPKGKDWEHAIGWAAREHVAHYFHARQPVGVTLLFRMHRPKSSRKSVLFPATRPDL